MFLRQLHSISSIYEKYCSSSKLGMVKCYKKNLFYYVVVYSKCCVVLKSILLMCNSCVLSVLFVSLIHSFSGKLYHVVSHSHCLAHGLVVTCLCAY